MIYVAQNYLYIIFFDVKVRLLISHQSSSTNFPNFRTVLVYIFLIKCFTECSNRHVNAKFTRIDERNRKLRRPFHLFVVVK